MGKYKVRIEETSARTVIIEAKNENDAVDKIRDLYRNCEIILDENDFIDADIECRGLADETDKELFIEVQVPIKRTCCNCCYAGEKEGNLFCNLGDGPCYKQPITDDTSCEEFEEI